MSFIKTVFVKDMLMLNQGIEDTKQRDVNVSWPSESLAQLGPIAVGECQRSLFYKILGVKPTSPVSVSSMFNYQAGTIYENYHVERFKKAGVFQESQHKFEFEIPGISNKIVMSGKCDLILRLGNRRSAVEVKTVSAYISPDRFGEDKKTGLPSASNLMQAMIYNYYFKYTEEGKKYDVEDVYLMYVDRSSGNICYYRVDMDDQGYAILTAIDLTGRQYNTIKLVDVLSFDDLSTYKDISRDDARKAELRISMQDIFDKFNTVYDHVQEKILPAKDYQLVYSPDKLELNYKLGRISTIKYNASKSGKKSCGDSHCSFCSYLKKCMSDDGMSIK